MVCVILTEIHTRQLCMSVCTGNYKLEHMQHPSPLWLHVLKKGVRQEVSTSHCITTWFPAAGAMYGNITVIPYWLVFPRQSRLKQSSESCDWWWQGLKQNKQLRKVSKCWTQKICKGKHRRESCSSPSSDPNSTPDSSLSPKQLSAVSPCIPGGNLLLQCTPGSAVLASADTAGEGCVVKAALVGERGSWQPSPYIPPDSRAGCGYMSSVLAGKAAALGITQYTNRHKCQERELIWPLLPSHAGRWCLADPHSCGCETEFLSKWVSYFVLSSRQEMYLFVLIRNLQPTEYMGAYKLMLHLPCTFYNRRLQILTQHALPQGESVCYHCVCPAQFARCDFIVLNP